LTNPCIDFLVNAWSALRQKDLEDSNATGGIRVLPITTRTYETLIRLATAHAKLRLSKTVDLEDAQ